MIESVGHKIKALREQKDMTQKDLAYLVGVHQSKISQCETGERGISFALAVKIASALGVPVDELASRSVPEPTELEVA